MKLSILVPSKDPHDAEKLLRNIKETAYDFNSLEIIFCFDSNIKHKKFNYDNVIVVYEPKTNPLYLSRHFNTCYRACSGNWIMIGNDDIKFVTKHWDKILDLENRNPYNLLYWDDQDMRSKFSCHPICSAEAWRLLDKNGLIFDDWKNMGCDTTFWDCIPDALKVYIPEIQIEHHRYLDDQKQLEIYADYINYNKKGYIREAVRHYISTKAGLRKESKVLIGAITAEFVRQAGFIPYMLGLVKPQNSYLVTMHGQSPAEARNAIAKMAIANNFTHVFFMDDDMAIPPDTLLNLLAHDKDMITGLYLMRKYPHYPVAFNREAGGGYHEHLSLTPHLGNLQEVTNAGLGCALIKTEVFEKMGDKEWFTLGQIKKDGWSDDIDFFNRARALGYKLYLDPKCVCGHMTYATIWPEQKLDGSWIIKYQHDEGNVNFPASAIQSQHEVKNV